MVARHRRLCLRIPRVIRADGGRWVIRFYPGAASCYSWEQAIQVALRGVPRV
jgi:hypothetical protein